MKYYKFIILCSLFLLSGYAGESASKTEDDMIHIDWDYGVRYIVNENNNDTLSEIRLYIDPEREGVIASLAITVPKDIDETDEKITNEMM